MRDGKRDGKEGSGKAIRRKEGMKGYSLNVYDRRRGEKKIKEDSSRCKYPPNIPKFCCINVPQSTLKLLLIDRKTRVF